MVFISSSDSDYFCNSVGFSYETVWFLISFQIQIIFGTAWFLISCPDSYFFLVQCGFLSLAQIHTIFRTVWFLISCQDSYYFWDSVVSYLLPRFRRQSGGENSKHFNFSITSESVRQTNFYRYSVIKISTSVFFQRRHILFVNKRLEKIAV